jgi:magnesium transporter
MVATCLQEKDAFIWLDFEAPSDEDLNFLENTFQFHPLALEDARTKFNLPKIDSYDSYLFLIWHAVVGSVADTRAEGVTAETDIFVAQNYLVSTHDRKVPALDEIYQTLLKEEQLVQKGTDWLLHRLLDAFVDAYFPLTDAISDGLDALEDEIFENPTPEHLKTLFNYKHQLLHLRKIVGPEREIAGSLARYPSLIREHTQFYFADVHDHLIRIMDFIDTARDIIGSAMDIYLSQISNRLNEVMKTLTVVTVILLPLTLITGVYGMNFRYLPELTFRYGYFAVLLLMAIVAASLGLYFKKKKWW